MAKVRETRELVEELTKQFEAHIASMGELVKFLESRISLLESTSKKIDENLAALERSGRS